MTSKFKTGDTVRCTDTGGLSHLRKGTVYTVQATDHEGVYLHPCGYGLDKRFELVSPVGAGTIDPTRSDWGFNRPGQGIKHDNGKLQWSLIPMAYLRGMVRVLMVGAKKYSPNNWRAGMPWSQPYNALHRHLDAWQAGEDLDPETGENHLDHALCELLFLRGFVQDHPKLDDRFKAAA